MTQISSPQVIIIGAGMAGLAAALELKRLGLSYLILEAASQPGGRAITHITATGTPVDMGAHWLHSEGTPLKAIVEHYGLACRADEAGDMLICENGTTRRDEAEDWLDAALDHAKADAIRSGALPDCPLHELGKDAAARKMLMEFGLMWDGVQPPLYPSALEFLSDENTPGGLQLPGGIGAITAAMAADAGHITFNTVVTAISADGDGVTVQAAEDTWRADHVLVTVSLGVLTSGALAFTPPFSDDLQAHLAGITMGTMNKIVAEIDPTFFADRHIPGDLSLELLDGDPPHYCHVRSAGLPLISLYISGRHAAEVEDFDADAARAYLRHALAPVALLAGYDDHLAGAPIVSTWVGNPFTRGAYSACLPGGKRSGPRFEGRIGFCGDTFDTRFPASLAGAFRSGQAAAMEVTRLIRS